MKPDKNLIEWSFGKLGPENIPEWVMGILVPSFRRYLEPIVAMKSKVWEGGVRKKDKDVLVALEGGFGLYLIYGIIFFVAFFLLGEACVSLGGGLVGGVVQKIGLVGLSVGVGQSLFWGVEASRFKGAKTSRRKYFPSPKWVMVAYFGASLLVAGVIIR
ncbi:hypothetical protein [Nocardiopsis chromatogenes]|uniref:hypothetical protein n=1 Tax=Nocardiopsis chromatogenes TaxID=280239 RepID=UPI0012686163|nr:hypothetical protein [Nocardiopsis chromatogenes]